MESPERSTKRVTITKRVNEHVVEGSTNKKAQKHPVLKRILIILAAVLVAALTATVVYMCTPMKATDEAYAVMTSSDQTVFTPARKSAEDSYQYGLVFYPGARVEPAAYAPLLQKLADAGWLVVTVDAPAHFMLLNEYAAQSVIADYPQVEHWYVGGHSLGGVCASDFAAKYTSEVDGVILLGSRPNTNLSETSLNVIAIRGSNDQICTEEKLTGALSLLPSDVHTLTIAGGNHAQYGYYGEQTGDGQATISADSQQTQTVDFILANL